MISVKAPVPRRPRMLSPISAMEGAALAAHSPGVTFSKRKAPAESVVVSSSEPKPALA